MNKILTLLSIAALLFSPVAFSFDPTDATAAALGIPGEKLDGGLGQLSSTYAAEEFRAHRVAGEKLDSGLGTLPPAYTGAEYRASRIAGESLDSGLGELSPGYTASEFQKNAQVVAAR